MTSGTRPPSRRPSLRGLQPCGVLSQPGSGTAGGLRADSSGGFPGYAGCDWRPDPISGLRRGTPGRVQYLCAHWSPVLHYQRSGLNQLYRNGSNRYGEPVPAYRGDPGAIGNEYTGPILPITAIPGLTSAQITDILVPGDDTETDSSISGTAD